MKFAQNITMGWDTFPYIAIQNRLNILEFTCFCPINMKLYQNMCFHDIKPAFKMGPGTNQGKKKQLLYTNHK